jgi:hypothetical protein
VRTKNVTVFIKFWRFNAFDDEAFPDDVNDLKTIAIALRLCVLDGNVSAELQESLYYTGYFTSGDEPDVI